MLERTKHLFIIKFTLFIGVFLIGQTSLFCQSHPTLSFDLLYSGFSDPISITNAGDGSNRLFVVERAGRVKIVENGSTLPELFLDINDKVSTTSERGLLGLTFHPDYPGQPYIYIHYSDLDGDSQISRFSVNLAEPNVVDTSTEATILLIGQPAGNHNGGTLLFGPDGYLYIGMGDGGPSDRAQNPQTLLGKMLRIDVDNGLPYTIPSTNPFVNDGSTLNEIWALGLRNPFRWSFDRLTGDLWIGDVGQSSWEEFNFQPASSDGGENYGWQCYEGNATFNTSGCGPISNYTFPIFQYANGTGPFAVTGGMVYRGKNACLQGVYIAADSRNSKAYTIVPDGSGGWSGQEHPLGISSVVGFGEDEQGELYAVSLSTDAVYKINGTSIEITQNPIPSGTYSAGSFLSSASMVQNGSNVVFKSGESIEFLPLFEVQLGAILTGEIGCDN